MNNVILKNSYLGNIMNQYLKFVIEKFDTESRTALDTAISHAISLHHKEVMPEHLLLSLLNQQYSLIESLSLQVGFSINNIIDATHKSLGNIHPCQIQSPVFSHGLVQWLLNCWMFASVTLGKYSLSPAMLIAGLFEESVIQTLSSNIQQNINFDYVQIQYLLCEDNRNMQSGDKSTVLRNKELEKYTHNLSELARRGKLDPVIGREAEIRQMIDILLRRKQNNPILTGEPGVGKTALAEGLALRIAAGSVPEMLKLAEVLTLDLSLLQAGANVKGEFELRLQSILKEVNKSPYPIILFIDEAHTLIGAGGLAGQNDAANLLKPALARGELRVIAATTWAEYKKYFEKDAALVRRFQVVKVAEPDVETAEAMLRAVVPKIVRHHGIPVLESAIHAAVALSSRYMADRHLPDKAISLLDTACARVAVSQVHEPKEVERIKVQLLAIREECKALTYEHTAPERIKELKQQAELLQDQLNSLHQLWKKQLELVKQLLRTQSYDEIIRGRETLGTYHQEHAMVFECVDATCVADVLSEWTGIPLGRMLEKESQQLNLLSDRLSERIIGQSFALDTITQQIRISRVGLADPLKPTGVYLLAGPSGTGKTETSLALAELLFGGEQNLVTINMSEYQEAHSVSGLKGSPPGYVGYGQGGILTEAVRRNPYCVVLLDEVEKAHPDVMELFYQVFDKGYIEDSEGQIINFRNTLIIMTSNIASTQLVSAFENGIHEPEMLRSIIRPEFEKALSPALMGRIVLIPFFPLQPETLELIVEKKLQQLCDRYWKVAKCRELPVWSGRVISWLAEHCELKQSGARDIDHVINQHLLPLLTKSIYQNSNSGTLTIDVDNNKLVCL